MIRSKPTKSWENKTSNWKARSHSLSQRKCIWQKQDRNKEYWAKSNKISVTKMRRHLISSRYRSCFPKRTSCFWKSKSYHRSRKIFLINSRSHACLNHRKWWWWCRMRPTSSNSKHTPTKEYISHRFPLQSRQIMCESSPKIRQPISTRIKPNKRRKASLSLMNSCPFNTRGEVFRARSSWTRRQSTKSSTPSNGRFPCRRGKMCPPPSKPTDLCTTKVSSSSDLGLETSMCKWTHFWEQTSIHSPPLTTRTISPSKISSWKNKKSNNCSIPWRSRRTTITGKRARSYSTEKLSPTIRPTSRSFSLTSK